VPDQLPDNWREEWVASNRRGESVRDVAREVGAFLWKARYGFVAALIVLAGTKLAGLI
jgi:hypothetical protein